MSTIVLNTKTYTWQGLVNGASSFIERSLGVVAGFSTLTMKAFYGKKKVAIRHRLHVTSLVSESSACACPGQILDEAYATIEVNFNDTASPAFREDVRLRIQGLVASGVFADSLDDLAIPMS